MSTALSTAARAALSWTITKTDVLGDTTNSTGLNFSDNLTNGVAVDTADLLYYSIATITASGNLQLDLRGSLTNVFGDSVVFVRVKAVMITFQSDNTASGLVIGGGTDGTGTNAFIGWFGADDHTEAVNKTGAFWKYRSDATGWVTVAGTGDIFTITNADGALSAKIYVAVIGCSA